MLIEKDKLALAVIRDAIQKIRLCASRFSDSQAFFDDWISFDAAMMNFVVIGEMVDKLSPSLKQEPSHIDWQQVKDFRNLIAHNYLGIDHEEIWEIIQTHIPPLVAFLEQKLGSV
ncbi:MAG: HepT-like ribonuclease domain-containing protein [Candidatus Margulisiibacteriota bacterium]